MRRVLSIARAPLLLFAAICGVETLLILRLNEGSFTYTLDDPYIHLAMAESLAQGHYGVNPGEVSAPSSSILWPFLLAPFAVSRFDHFVPLVANWLVSLGTIVLFARFVADAIPASEVRSAPRAPAVLVTLLVLTTNVVGLAFNGMEHSLQLFVAVAIVLGLVRVSVGGERPGWLPIAIVGAVLVRYENLALAVPALALLSVYGHRRAAAWTALALGVSLSAYALWLASMGLGVVPSSVVAKSNPVATGGSLRALAGNVSVGLATRQGAFLGLAGALLGMAALSARRRARERWLAAAGVAAVGLHFLVGRFGWYHRYEIYAWAAATLLLLHLHRGWLVRPGHVRWGMAIPVALGLVAGFPYAHALYTLPVAASNIHEQHYQMHRFATDYWKAPVAVNDLGWVAYRNEEYVLDLWGLASRRALDLRVESSDAAWIELLAREHDVKLAMIYAPWFGDLPANWIELGHLRLGRKLVSAARRVVTFYALDEESERRARVHLDEFVPTLPRGVRFDPPGTVSDR